MSLLPSAFGDSLPDPVPVGVLVVDDQLAVREGISRLIACASMPMVCVGTAANGAQALLALARVRPEVVVLDADLAGEDGLALIPLLSLHAVVLVLTSHGDPATRQRAARLGARAFIEKHEPAAVLLESIVNLATRSHPAAGRDAELADRQSVSSRPTLS